MNEAIDILAHVDALFFDAQQRGHAVLRLRIGEDLRTIFEQKAGHAYVTSQSGDGRYFGVPVSFDAIDPETAVVETEPL
jgi:hypothetical protein